MNWQLFGFFFLRKNGKDLLIQLQNVMIIISSSSGGGSSINVIFFSFFLVNGVR